MCVFKAVELYYFVEICRLGIAKTITGFLFESCKFDKKQ